MFTITRIPDFAALRPQWEELHRQSDTSSVFNSFSWLTTWWSSFGDPAELLLLAVWENNNLRGIAPLMIFEGVISFVGGRAVSDVLDFITYPGYETAITNAVADYLSQQPWKAIWLRGLQEHTDTLKVFCAASQQMKAQPTIETEEVSPVAELQPSWDAQLATLSKKDRHELRRKLRRLDDSVQWSWYALTGPAAGDRELGDFLRLMRLSTSEKAGFMTDKMEHFFRGALRPSLDQHIASIYFLEIEGQRVSSTICFDQRDELWLYNSGFNPAYASLSVGLLLKALCLKDAIEQGKRRFDFLRGNEPYKYDLGAHDQPLFSLRLTRADGVVSGQFLDEFERPKETPTCLE
jgi:CelD/BcsL family acetyltransferase involved in cellulose biosynthesis